MLNAKQQRFVDEYLKDLNATQAAVRAGYSENTANRVGPRLLSNVGIKKAIAAAQKLVSQKTEIEVIDIINDLQRLAGKAERAGNFSSAIKCKELLGKQIGMFIERIKVEDDSVIEIRWINQKENADNSSPADAPGAVGDIQRPDAV
jgi:phage terminase small subunit